VVVEETRLGKPYRSGCTLPWEGSHLVHHPVLVRTSDAKASRHNDLDIDLASEKK
jgi:hypothetical protein